MMKKIIAVLIILVTVAVIFMACNPSSTPEKDNNAPNDNAKPDELTGSWELTAYMEINEDGETEQFNRTDLISQILIPQEIEPANSDDEYGETNIWLLLWVYSTWDFHDDGTFSMTLLDEIKEYFEGLQKNDPPAFQNVIDVTNGTWVKSGISPLGGTIYTLTIQLDEQIFNLTVKDGSLSIDYGSMTLYLERLKSDSSNNPSENSDSESKIEQTQASNFLTEMEAENILLAWVGNTYFNKKYEIDKPRNETKDGVEYYNFWFLYIGENENLMGVYTREHSIYINKETGEMFNAERLTNELIPIDEWYDGYKIEYGDRYNDSVNAPVIDILGEWYFSYDEINEYSNKLTLNSDNTFHLYLNLLVGMGGIYGTYNVTDDGINIECTVTSRDYAGFVGDDVNAFTFIIGNGGLIYFGGYIL